jgi:hypothetical protein
MGLVGDDDLGAGQGQVECCAAPSTPAPMIATRTSSRPSRLGGHGAAEDTAPVHPSRTAAACDRG